MVQVGPEIPSATQGARLSTPSRSPAACSFNLPQEKNASASPGASNPSRNRGRPAGTPDGAGAGIRKLGRFITIRTMAEGAPPTPSSPPTSPTSKEVPGRNPRNARSRRRASLPGALSGTAGVAGFRQSRCERIVIDSGKIFQRLQDSPKSPPAVLPSSSLHRRAAPLRSPWRRENEKAQPAGWNHLKSGAIDHGPNRGR